MLIRFSPHLDGLNPARPATAVGEASVGPMGLLRMLESDLGLAPVFEHPAELIVAYRGCLAELDDEHRFYHRSFAVDPMSVAATLHDWRRRWYEAGWSGTFPAGVSARLSDMAVVEKIARDRVPFCLGQRLGRVLEMLAGRRTQIERLIVEEDPQALTLMWRRVIEVIGYQVADGIESLPGAVDGTDLERVQTLLSEASAGGDPSRLRLAGDGSFVVMRSASRDLSARAVAEAVRLETDASDTLVIAERDGIIIDNAMERTGLARCGFQHYSRFRAVSQVLKLCLAILWEPVNPHLLLQFFIHPLGPVRGDVRRALAEAVAAEPGIGGRAWEETIAGLEKRLEDRGVAAAEVRAVRATIAEWFEGERYDAETGAPFAALFTRGQACADWLARRLAVTEDPGEGAMFAGAAAQTNTLIAALKALADQGRATMGRIELERLVDEISRQQPDPEIFAEAGRARASVHPGSVTASWRQVVWWDLSPPAQDFTYPWSNRELESLRGAGVMLPPMETLLAARSRTWLRPIVNCRERCLLVVHHSDQGQHPLWSQIENLIDDVPTIDLDAALLEGGAERLPFLDVPLKALPLSPLPGIRRWWELPSAVTIPGREEESYSSLNKLFHHPHEWVLNYPARLRTGRAEDLADGARLYGTLAHRLFENFFNAHESWRELTDSDIDAWIDEALPRLIREEGAVLLEPGRGVDHEQVTAVLERALPRLVGHLVDADIVRVEPERQENAPYGAGELGVRGTIDLLLTRADGQEIVVDAKWGGEAYRGQELETNRHLQLASYAYLRKTAAGSNQWPYQAYFIVSSGNMLAPDAEVFPEAQVWTPDGGIDVAGLWSRGEQTYAWRREQLDRGEIEVNVEGASPTGRSEPPEAGLDTLVPPDRFDDYTNLTGWDEFA